MDTSKIVETLNAFVVGNNKSIVLDGKWGIGKTYKINEFLKGFYSKFNKKKYRVHYVSLFGKKGIEEIHTEVYSKLHPNIDLVSKSIKLVSPASKFIPGDFDITDSLDYILGVANKTSLESNDISLTVEKGPVNYGKRIIRKFKRLKQKHVFIFDDLERKSPDLKFTELEGYYNTLFLNGIKVISVCNMSYFNSEEKKDDKKDFDSFKEKVFDRIYNLTSNDDTIIKNYFDYDNVILTESITRLFDNNLRNAEKTSIFYQEVLNDLMKNKIKIDNKERLLWYCSLVVIGFNGNSIPEIDDKDREKYDLFLSQFEDDTSLSRLVSIMVYDNNVMSEFRVSDNYTMLMAIYNMYFYNDDRNLCLIFGKSSAKNKKSLYLLTVDNRKSLIEKELRQYLKQNKLLEKTDYSRLQEMFSYEELFPNWFNVSDLEDKIAELASKDFEKFEEVYNMLYMPPMVASFQTFIESTYKKCSDIILNNMIHDFLSAIKLQKLSRVKESLVSFSCDKICKKDGELDPKIVDMFSNNNYFRPDFKKDIDEKNWDIFKCLFHFYQENAVLGKAFKKQLNDIGNNSNDVSEKEKIDSLVKWLK